MLPVLITHGSVRRKNICLVHAFLSAWMVFLSFKARDLNRWLETRTQSATPNWRARFIVMCFVSAILGCVIVADYQAALGRGSWFFTKC